jgi:dihydrolipoamide dehydrogenase
MMPSIATVLDGQVGRTLQRLLARQGFEFRLGTKVVGAEVHGEKVRLVVESGDGRDDIECDRLLVAVGRRPLTRGLGLEEIGVRVHPGGGHVLVDDRYRTSVPTIYAIGDLIPGPMLAHKASAEGIAAVECMAGLPGEVNYDTIPSVIYTSPEVASVGLTEEQAKDRGLHYCVGSYPFAGSGRARSMGETDGFVKVIVHAKTDRILGVHIIGPRASDMIEEGVLAMEFRATSSDIGRTVHGHPTFSEALHEAAQAARKCAIYAP